MVKNTGYKLYKKKGMKNILGGNMLLSKNPDMLLPKFWPTYFLKSKDSHIWDLDGRKYFDAMCLVGQNILGYANKAVDRAVTKRIANGSMNSLNSPDEIKLSSLLINLHPWANMCKFAKSGGEANAIAIRIARAASKKDNVAVCGYHGWHDWYLSVNLKKKSKNNLDDHLFPGLKIDGVPKALSKTTHPFSYGDFKTLENIHKKNNLGVIKMEVGRNKLPDINFLNKVRDFCDKKKIILIFDECTSGFRRNLGGLHMEYKVFPDIAMFGKALGNGYPITAVIGRESVMKKASETFISSTFWTEGIGFAAALATLNEMKRIKSWKIISEYGGKINEKWKYLAEKNNIKIKIFGIGSISSFSINPKKDLAYKTFITQEFLKNGIMASNLIYCNIFHNSKNMKKYFYVLDKIFKKIRKFEDGEKINPYLKGPICLKPFKRINQ
jgi:glutamate-1-semialdehyde aminotransferase